MAFGDFTVTRASTKLRIGSNGLYGSVANNVPAFEFNTDGTYRGLLVEPGATNLVANPGLAGGATPTGWTRVVSGGTVVAEDSAEFESALGVKRIAFSATSNREFIGRSIALTNGQTYTWSIFVEDISAITGSNVIASIATSATGTDAIIVQSQITASDVVNGYAQKTFTVADASALYTIRFGIGAITTATGNVTISSPQVENSSVQTSRIVNTTNSTASRVADVVSLTGASSLIGQQEGWVFAECAFRSTSTDATATPSGFVLGNTATSARGIAFGVGAANTILTESRNDSGQTTSTIVASYTLGQRFKIALYYNFSNQAVNTTVTNGLKVFYNGTLQGTYDLRVPPSASFLDNVAFQGRIRGTSPTTPSDSKHALSFAIGVGTLSDAQGIALTTL
jgi:hypothetical protein